jgi:hypothetical protein
MTGRWSWIALGMLASLLASGAASAECAWVLWVMEGTKVDHLYASYASANGCIQELDAFERRNRPDKTLLTTRSAATSLNVTDKIKASFSKTYQFLPDTVDPRGPKGK